MNYKSSQKGWNVRLPDMPSKLFDKLKDAIGYRDHTLKKIYPKQYKQMLKSKPKPKQTSKTGIKNICLKNKNYPTYICNFYKKSDGENIRQTLSFSIAKYGREKAFIKACKALIRKSGYIEFYDKDLLPIPFYKIKNTVKGLYLSN